jgi:hypothetical protein
LYPHRGVRGKTTQNRHYKDSVFTLLFNDPSRLRELYNAIENSSYGEDTDISINTLNNVLFMDRNNDISFTIDNKLVVLLEHQSTINPNMPLRFLLYIARIYEKIIENEAIYRHLLLPIPTPEFIVLYNGKASQPDETILRLSDTFIAGDVPAGLELTVRILNVNAGHNRRILSRSHTLKEYAEFIAKAREYEKTEGEEYLKKTVEYCIDHGILKYFLTEHASEVVNMLLSEWNWDDARRVWKEEGIQIGEVKGEARVLELLKARGYDTSELEAELNVSPRPEVSPRTGGN